MLELAKFWPLKWDYVDLDRGLLLLPDSKTGKAKTIVLNAPSLQVLADLPHVGNYVISGASAGKRGARSRALTSNDPGRWFIAMPGSMM